MNLYPFKILVQVITGKNNTVEFSSYTAESLLAELEVEELQAA